MIEQVWAPAYEVPRRTVSIPIFSRTKSYISFGPPIAITARPVLTEHGTARTHGDHRLLKLDVDSAHTLVRQLS